MTRTAKLTPIALVLALSAAGAAGCGEEGISIASSDANHRGAELFAQRCAGCHTFDYAGAQGGAAKKNVTGRERTDGPNFNVRKETVQNVLYAIRNGGFSGAIMPQNIVVGPDAQAIATFVAKYAGSKAPKRVSPQAPAPAVLPDTSTTP